MSGASAKENTGTRKEPWIKRNRRDSWLCFFGRIAQNLKDTGDENRQNIKMAAEITKW